MSGTLFPTIVGFGVGGLGIGLGGLVACIFGHRFIRFCDYTLAISAGMIFSLLAFEILPESVKTGGIIATLLGVLIGLLVILKLEHQLHRVVIITNHPQRSLFIRSGVLLALGIAIHNFPVGFALGAGLVNQQPVGFDLAITMLFHSFPEGLAVSLPMIFAGLSRTFIPVTASIVALPAGLGSFIGSMLGEISPLVLSLFFGVAIGTVFFVTWHEILGHSRKQLTLKTLLPCVGLGLLFGKVFISVI